MVRLGSAGRWPCGQWWWWGVLAVVACGAQGSTPSRTPCGRLKSSREGGRRALHCTALQISHLAPPAAANDRPAQSALALALALAPAVADNRCCSSASSSNSLRPPPRADRPRRTYAPETRTCASGRVSGGARWAVGMAWRATRVVVVPPPTKKSVCLAGRACPGHARPVEERASTTDD